MERESFVVVMLFNLSVTSVIYLALTNNYIQREVELGQIDQIIAHAAG
jgi:hypothetical protein